MSTFSMNDTIAALATPSGEGGISVIRISGPAAPSLLEKIFLPSSHREPSSFQSHKLYYGKFITPEEILLDEGLAVWMKSPRSFTGEEVVELHLHGGRLIPLKVLETLYRLGARPANPGEFSERAFSNGKMDLTQAEAIADMIAAKSEQALRLAQRQWQGALSTPVANLRKTLIDLLVNLEAAVDFPEEEIEILDRNATAALIQKASVQIEEWLQTYELGRVLREGLLVVLVGKPNVGKSSLLNLFAREEAAIVHDEPGTTRDAVERSVSLRGIAIRLIDTAGIRSAEGIVEQKGIERSRQWLEKADLVFALFDTANPLEKEDFEILKLIESKKTILVLNKQDLPPAWNPDRLLKVLPQEPFFPAVRLSTRTSEGLSELEEALFQQLQWQDFEKENTVLINQLRHKQALEKACQALDSALRALRLHYSPELIATDIQVALQALGEIIGEVSTEEILGEIFGRFCIGK